MQSNLFPERSPGSVLLSGLDPDQHRAVFHPSGPLLLVAGAGSGKTRAIVARIARLLQEGVPAKRILGITFTNRAAEEMRERVAKAFPGVRELPWLGTFHAFGALLLRRHGARIGLDPRFLIYDTRDQLDVLRQILKDQNIDEKKFPPGRFADLIEKAKRSGGTMEQAAIAAGWLFVEKAENVARAYDAALAQAGAIDFTDLIRLPVKLFREAPDVLDAVRSDVRHLLVDEFQDVDAGQAALTRMLAQGADSFCAVGDEDQSIYGWRGGSAGPMLAFERDYPGATVVHLSTNYRTRAAILSAAAASIGKNRARRPKEIVAARDGGDPPVVRIFGDADREAREVAAAVAGELRRGVPAPEIAVFYRVNAQSRSIEDALRTLDVRYVLRGALSFYERAVVRDAVAYLKWFLHPDDLVSLRRLLKSPRRGVGDATLARATENARLDGVAPSVMLARIPQLSPLFAFREEWLAALPSRRVGEAIRSLLAGAGYLDWLEDGGSGVTEKEREDDKENIRELLRMADAFPGEGEDGLQEYLEKMSLAPRDMKEEEDGAIRLMTLHNAKGLEFSVIFLVGLEEGLLPHSRSGESEDDVEEERRLFYVGLTRARERAYLSFARRRFLFGSWKETVPSRYLAEIPPALLRWEDDGGGEVQARPGGGYAGERPRVSHSREDAASVAGRSLYGERPIYGNRPQPAGRPFATGRPAPAGRPPLRWSEQPARREEPAIPASDAGNGKDRPSRVRHPLFGEGRVEAVEGEGPDRKFIVRFPGYGIKKLLVRVAKMEILY